MKREPEPVSARLSDTRRRGTAVLFVERSGELRERAGLSPQAAERRETSLKRRRLSRGQLIVGPADRNRVIYHGQAELP